MGFSYIPSFNVDPNLLTYYNEFMGITNFYCPKLKFPLKFSLEYGSLADPTIGVCYRKFNNRHVTIDKSYYNSTADKNKRALVFHELTHCILNLDHVSDYNNYMAPDLNESIAYDAVTNQLVDNLISVCGGTNDRP